VCFGTEFVFCVSIRGSPSDRRLAKRSLLCKVYLPTLKATGSEGLNFGSLPARGELCRTRSACRDPRLAEGNNPGVWIWIERRALLAVRLSIILSILCVYLRILCGVYTAVVSV